MAYEEIIFPNNIRNIRLSSGMKMTELARRAKLSLSAVSKIEKGVRRLNESQLMNVCGILGCKLSDVFIKESDNLANKWQDEMNRRLSGNASGGLKLFGSGLRAIRAKSGKTIANAAKDAGMTLSVYHKIEIGQRELYENELPPLAKSFGMTPDAMYAKIAELYKAGNLAKYMAKTDEKVKSVMAPGKAVSGIELYGAKLYDDARKKLVPVFGTPGTKGIVFKKTDESMIASPIGLEGRRGIYAIIPNVKRLNGVLPADCKMFADTNAVAATGDLAILLESDFDKLADDDTAHAQIVMLREDARGKIYGQTWGPDEKIAIKKTTGILHKIVMITMA